MILFLRRCRFLWGVALLGFLASVSSQASLLRIIHTNDLHSHFDHATEAHRGGFAAVKAVIDGLKAEARASNIPTLILDAGDFSEGSEFYFSDGGLYSFDVLNAMGYDAVALGNHDYLMGGARLNEILGLTGFSFPLLGANFQCPRFSHINDHLKNHASFVFGQGSNRVRVAVMGLTTNDTNYTWRVAGECNVLKPVDVAIRAIPELRANHDFVFALTHIGVDEDKTLVRRTEGLDLVIGGHSHTMLQHAESARTPRGKVVPIVQAGQHGEFVGDLLVDIYPGSPLQILRYRLVPVNNQNQAGDPLVLEKISQAQRALEAGYGRLWLNAIVGISEVPLASPRLEATEWGDFVAESFRQTGGADIAFNIGRFDGNDQPPGPVTRLKIMASYPRMFEVEKRLGWNVWVTDVHGAFMKSTLQDLMDQGISFSAAGVRVVTAPDPATKKYQIREIYFEGRPLEPFRLYRVALPEGVIRGAHESQPGLAGLVMKNSFDTGIPIWRAMERHLRRIGGVIKKYPPGTHRPRFNPDPGLSVSIDP